MSDFSRILTFVRPFRAQLVLSLVLLLLAGLGEVMTTALAIPLFDDVLSVSKPEQTSGGYRARAQAPDTPDSSLHGATSPSAKLRFLWRYLGILPGGILAQLSIALVALTALKGISIYSSNYLMGHVGQSVVLHLRNRLFEHVVGQSIGFFAANSTGRLMSCMNSDVEQVQEAVSTSLAELFRESVLLIALVMWVFYIDWKLASLALLIAPAALLLTVAMGRNIRRVSLRSRESVANLNDLLQQSITGMKVIKAFGREHHERMRFGRGAGHLLAVNMRAAKIVFLNSPVMELLGVVCFIPLLYYAHARISEGTLTMGIFGGSLFSLFRMYDPIRKLSRLHVQFQRAFASISRIMELLATHMEIQDRPDALELSGVNRGIEYRNVCFDYRDATGATRVLRNINLSVTPRQIVAVVGSSGSGKSTLVSLLPRFYDVTSGSITIDGIDIRDLSQASLRRNIAVVTQETFLFNDSVRNNIAYGRLGASGDEIVAAARAALAHDFIMQLPMRYETLLGERGQRLSGGERQRISIARAILKNAPILILDEATSALDSEAEKLVQLALANLMRERTTFVIAHRLSTIRNADLILVLDDGRLAETGTHEELLQRNGLYTRFYRIQTHDGFLVDAMP
ncbi:MAG: ABC transporter ATP-binding protein [Acidobacteria bacterium]|nr:ABC transporter ATP-binding protein [Acidobacteriota bacterium]